MLAERNNANSIDPSTHSPKCEKSISYFSGFSSNELIRFFNVVLAAEWFSLSNALYRIGRKIVVFRSFMLVCEKVCVCVCLFYAVYKTHFRSKWTLMNYSENWSSMRGWFKHFDLFQESTNDFELWYNKIRKKSLFFLIYYKWDELEFVCVNQRFQCAFGIVSNIFHADSLFQLVFT